MNNILIVSKFKNVYDMFKNEFVKESRDNICYHKDSILEAAEMVSKNTFKYMIYDDSTYDKIFVTHLEEIQEESKVKIIIYANKFEFEHIKYIGSKHLTCYLTESCINSNISSVLEKSNTENKFVSPDVFIDCSKREIEKLTIYELELSKLLKEGFTNTEISEKLDVNKIDLKLKIYDIYRKLRIGSVKELKKLTR